MDEKTKQTNRESQRKSENGLKHYAATIPIDLMERAEKIFNAKYPHNGNSRNISSIIRAALQSFNNANENLLKEK